MSPSSVIMTSGFLICGFTRVSDLIKTGGVFGQFKIVVENGSVRLNIVPPRPATQTFAPPRDAAACSNLLVPDGCIAHDRPPSWVISTLPRSPVAIALFCPVASTANRLFRNGDS